MQAKTSPSAASPIANHGPATLAMMALSVAGIITYCFGMPLWFYLRDIPAFSHLFSVLLLGVFPVAATMGVSHLLTPKEWKVVSRFTVWDWLALTLAVIVGQWAAFMGVSVVMLFLVPAEVMDQVAGAFFDYMVPLTGASWLAMAVYATVVLWMFHCVLPPARKSSKNEPYWHFARPVVLATLPASFVIYGIVQWLFYHFVPG